MLHDVLQNETHHNGSFASETAGRNKRRTLRREGGVIYGDCGTWTPEFSLRSSLET